MDITSIAQHLETVVAVIVAVVFALAWFLISLLRKFMRRNNSLPNTFGARPPTVSGSTTTSVKINGQPVAGDADTSAIVSQLLGDNGNTILQQALQAAAHNTSGKPVVFVNGKQVDAGSVNLDDFTGTSGDPQSRLHTLKALHDAGLISAPEFETKKADILESL